MLVPPNKERAVTSFIISIDKNSFPNHGLLFLHASEGEK